MYYYNIDKYTKIYYYFSIIVVTFVYKFHTLTVATINGIDVFYQNTFYSLN